MVVKGFLQPSGLLDFIYIESISKEEFIIGAVSGVSHHRDSALVSKQSSNWEEAFSMETKVKHRLMAGANDKSSV